MRRAALERPRTLRAWRAHSRIIHDGHPANCQCDEQPGRFRKGQRIGGCGRPRCGLCKAHNLYQKPTARDYRVAISYREWAAELGFCIRMLRRPGWASD